MLNKITILILLFSTTLYAQELPPDIWYGCINIDGLPAKNIELIRYEIKCSGNVEVDRPKTNEYGIYAIPIFDNETFYKLVVNHEKEFKPESAVWIPKNMIHPKE